MTKGVGTAWLDEMLATGWTGATVHAYLLSDTALFDPLVDLFLSDIPGIDRVSGPVALAGKSEGEGYFDANDFTLTLAEGAVAAWLVIVKIGGSEATSPIVGFSDEKADGSPILMTGSGGTVTFRVQDAGVGRT